MRARHLFSPSRFHCCWHLQTKTNAILWNISRTNSSEVLLWLPSTRTNAFLPALLRWALLVAEERAASRLHSPLLSSLSTRLGARRLNCNLSCWPHRSCYAEPRQRVALVELHKGQWWCWRGQLGVWDVPHWDCSGLRLCLPASGFSALVL